MIKNIWIFGDSFAEYKPDSLYHDYLSQHYRAPHYSYGLGGSAQEYTFYHVEQCLKKIGRNDLILIFLTDQSRAWMFEDRPDLAASTQLLSDFKDNKKYYNFFKTYFCEMNYLQHVKKIDQKIFLNYLALATRKMTIRPIIIKNFEHADYYIHPKLTYSNGALIRPSIGEFQGEFDFSYLLEEFRPNHLSECNQIILADKIINKIDNDVSIDMNAGFKTNLYPCPK